MSQVSNSIFALAIILSATSNNLSHASYQITLETDIQFLISQKLLAVNVNFSNQVQLENKLELNIFFDSEQLNLSQISPIDSGYTLIDAVLPDLKNLDNDPTTGKYINISMSDSGQNKLKTVPSKPLFRLIFDVKEDFHGAFIHATAKPISMNQPFVIPPLNHSSHK